jgi:O-acetyl-ADP-ribose deacetylase (regulator of RNase III)
MNYSEISGNLITKALSGEFDVITHGCNSHCIMGSGIAPQMAKTFGCDDFPMEHNDSCGDINKLGTIDYQSKLIHQEVAYNQDCERLLEDLNLACKRLYVVNSYTQFGIGKSLSGKIPVDYDAIRLCMRKINSIFEGSHIGLPQIGCGLGGGDWDIVKKIIQEELIDCKVTVVIFKK